MSNVQTLACTYAALLLHDAGVPVTAEGIAAATAAANVEVRPTLPILFARYIEKRSIDSLVSAAAAVAPTATAAPAPAAGAAAAGAKEDKKKEELEEEEGDDMGFGLFD
ncbi:large subunit ribosomal protein LP1 [Strigomonas culicis]|uniref:Large subunit ribosomal protein LP1 n=1 Tax=Strigomonas culicis TaxID=28005 RepID=S9VPW5_9TRYP|nr:large subunit ribosomal protein LP1 [Strigomonas culicis]EPY29086.1 large subunit ribosomal protein LP1 [Strigomonas culicis]|eukprot:EPY27767.1 large subunit ribosomal protein LP1 [Strigomonas culicis]